MSNSRNLPNTISLIRIASVPIIVIMLLSSGRTMSVITSVLFGVVSLTDWLDGYLARRMKVVTNLGKFLDPLADKLLITTALIMLIPPHRAPAWIVALIVGREVAVTGLRGMASNAGIVIAAGTLGKIKTVFQVLSILALILHYQFWNIDFHMIGTILLWIALILTLVSGVQYFMKFFKTID